MRDRRILYAAAFLRSLSVGMTGVLLGLYLARIGLGASWIGAIVGCGLAGGASASLLVTLAGDRLGRRRTLLAVALIGAAGSFAIAHPSMSDAAGPDPAGREAPAGASAPASPWAHAAPLALGAVAFAGMLNGMGRDRGAAMILDQAMLPATVSDAGRTRVFAWYNVLQDIGHAFGGGLAALPALLHQAAGIGELTALRASMAIAGGLMLATAALYAGLSRGVELSRTAEEPPVTPEGRVRDRSPICVPAVPDREPGSSRADPPSGVASSPEEHRSDRAAPAPAFGRGSVPADPSGLVASLPDEHRSGRAAPAPATTERRSPGTPRLSPASRRLLTRISALFVLDSLGGGFLTASLLSYFFYERFGVGEAAIGALFFGARVLNALSHLGAAWLAKRIGLVNTMVFTHIPSSLFLATVAIAPTFPVAAILFLLREGLVEMDVPTRQSYVMAVVRPEERTVASGVTHLVRMGAWALAPFAAGPMMAGVALAGPLVAGAGLKIVYDIALWVSFRHVKPPEER